LSGRSKTQRSRDYEAVRGDVHAAEAESLFVSLVNGVLPAEAFVELRGLLAAEEVEDWATKWRVNLPCVLRQARSFVAFAQLHPGSVDFLEDLGDIYIGPLATPAWSEHVNALDRLPVDQVWREDVLRNVLSETEAAKQLDALSDVPFTEDPTVTYHPNREHARFLREELALIREQRLDQESVLAPISADPFRESRESFLARASNHWKARVLHAQRFGLRHVSTRANLARDVGWLVRYHVLEQSLSEIAQGPPIVEKNAVDKAIRRVAPLVGFVLSPS
jgi:hypothetical protein